MQLHQIHLVGRGYCGRALRYRLLTAQEVREIELAVSQELGKDALLGEYLDRVQFDALELMIQKLTEPVSETDLPNAVWKPKPPLFMEQWDKAFGAKDTDLLRKLYAREHLVTEKDVEAILEKKVMVLEE